MTITKPSPFPRSRGDGSPWASSPASLQASWPFVQSTLCWGADQVWRLSPCSWKCLGESLLATYNHLTTCEPPRPSLGKRIDLSDHQDPSQPLVSSVVVAPVSVIQSSPVSANPAVTMTEPVLSYSPVAAASFSLHSSSLLETGIPHGRAGLLGLTSGEIQFADQE